MNESAPCPAANPLSTGLGFEIIMLADTPFLRFADGLVKVADVASVRREGAFLRVKLNQQDDGRSQSLLLRDLTVIPREQANPDQALADASSPFLTAEESSALTSHWMSCVSSGMWRLAPFGSFPMAASWRLGALGRPNADATPMFLDGEPIREILMRINARHSVPLFGWEAIRQRWPMYVAP